MKRDRLEQALTEQPIPNADAIYSGMARSSGPPARRKVEGLVPKGDGSFEYKRFIITPVGIEFPSDTTNDEWLDVGHVLKQLDTAIQWVIGDWADYASRIWEIPYDLIANEYGYEVETLYTYAGVARAFPTSIRNRGVTFAHHRLVISLTEEERVNWLASAAQHHWTLSQMREAIWPKPPALSNRNGTQLLFSREKKREIGKFFTIGIKAGQGDKKARKKALGYIAEHRRWLDQVEQMLNEEE